MKKNWLLVFLAVNCGLLFFQTDAFSAEVFVTEAQSGCDCEVLSKEAVDLFAKQANGGVPKKVIVVPGRLVNIVL
jgi:hypothetical protein